MFAMCAEYVCIGFVWDSMYICVFRACVHVCSASMSRGDVCECVCLSICVYSIIYTANVCEQNTYK